jgi:hypothetical protein
MLNHNLVIQTSAWIAAALSIAATGRADEWYVAPDGKPTAAGTKDSPWDIATALGGGQKVAPGDTVWISGGTYKHPKRDTGATGYEVRLAGQEGKPIHVRAARGERVTIDGGLAVVQPSTHLWIWDLEIIVSENFTMSRRIEEPGSSPQTYGRPWGGLGVHAGDGCKYINLVIHDNAQGVSFWSGATNSELHGCIIYDNGWDAPDRGHGHAIYTQNQNGVKTISDCIMTGGYGYTMHAYGSSRAYVDNYLAEGNIAYDGGQFLIGGGRPSQNIRVLKNYLFNVGMQLGYSAPQNDDCEVRDNVIVGGGLSINKFQKVVNEGNVVLSKSDPRPPDSVARIEMRPNRYDPNRMHVVVFNWKKSPTVSVQPESFFKPGDKFRVLNPRDFFGKPVLTGIYDGNALQIPVAAEFAAFVLIKEYAK